MSQGRGPRRRQYPLDKAKKLNFKILRSRDYGSCLVFAVLKLNRSCYILLAAQNTYYRLQTLNLTIICSKVRDRLSENSDENSYINQIPIPLSRVWIRYRARAIAGVKGNFRHSWEDLSCRHCNLGVDETQEHLETCGGTEFERRGLEMEKWRDRLLFWRRMTVKIAAVTKKKGPMT